MARLRFVSNRQTLPWLGFTASLAVVGLAIRHAGEKAIARVESRQQKVVIAPASTNPSREEMGLTTNWKLTERSWEAAAKEEPAEPQEDEMTRRAKAYDGLDIAVGRR